MFALNICLICLMALFSCNDPTIIGTDVISSDQADVRIMDTLTIRATTVKEDSIQTYKSLSQFSRYLVGNFNDPLFGNTKATIFSQFRLAPGFQYTATDSTFFNNNNIENMNTVLDSVILVLEYDSSGFFGNRLSPQNIEIYEIAEPMDNNATYYSNQEFLLGRFISKRNTLPG